MDLSDLFAEENSDAKIDAQNAINRLSPREAACLYLWITDHTQAEIAARMGCDQSTVSRVLASLHKSA